MPLPLTRKKILLAAALLPALLLVSLAISLTLGPSRILPWEILSSGPQGQLAWDVIVRVRLPRVFLGLIAGAALSGAGVAYQAILRNPLADPYILGISGGAALGAVLPLALAGGASAGWMALRPATAFLGAILATLVVFQLSRLRGRMTSYPMLLVGWVANSFFFALILFLETVLDFAELTGVLFWRVGSLASLTVPRPRQRSAVHLTSRDAPVGVPWARPTPRIQLADTRTATPPMAPVRTAPNAGPMTRPRSAPFSPLKTAVISSRLGECSCLRS